MVEHRPFDFTELVDETQPTGKRLYITPEGNKYPSVTTILGAMSDKSHLVAWRDRMGHEKADAYTRQAANRGTLLHAILEDYILGRLKPSSEYNPIIWNMFSGCRKHIDKHINLVYNVEFCLYSDRLKTAGRCDLLCQWDGVDTVLDWKSSTRPKKKEWITGYFHQKTLYCMMVYERIGLRIPQIITFISNEEDPEPQIFLEKTSNFVYDAHKIVKDFHNEKRIKD